MLGRFGNELKSGWQIQTSRAYRPPYELVRTGRLSELQRKLVSLLDAVLQADAGRPLSLAAGLEAQLPPFKDVSQYFSPSGLIVTSSNDGWLIQGVFLGD